MICRQAVVQTRPLQPSCPRNRDVEYFPSACKASFLLWSSVQSLWFINSVTTPGCHDVCSWWLKSHIIIFFIIPITPLSVWMPLNGFISHVLERYWWEAIRETGRGEKRKESAFLSGPQMRAGPRSPVLDFKYAPDLLTTEGHSASTFRGQTSQCNWVKGWILCSAILSWQSLRQYYCLAIQSHTSLLGNQSKWMYEPWSANVHK